jgi:hypothetical protein
MFLIIGKKAKYPALSWWENFMSGHINIGKRITIFGENAMRWQINIRTKRWGVICFTPPFKTFGKRNGCHIYFSPNGTPWASTYYKSIAFENNWQEEIRAKIRKKNFDHGFDTDLNRDKLRALNNKFDWLTITEYDIEKAINLK